MVHFALLHAPYNCWTARQYSERRPTAKPSAWDGDRQHEGFDLVRAPGRAATRCPSLRARTFLGERRAEGGPKPTALPSVDTNASAWIRPLGDAKGVGLGLVAR